MNGTSLSESAIVVDGKAHVPLRAVTDSLGASLKVEGKTVEITAEILLKHLNQRIVVI